MSTAGFTFDPVTHAYTSDAGLRIPSTTQALKMSGWVDFGMIAKDVLENKRGIGEAVHKCAQYFDEGDLDESTVLPEWAGYLDGWKKFVRESKVNILGTEQRSVGAINGMPFGMTYDRLAIVDGEESLLELKCCANKETYWGLQLASYDMGLPQCATALKRRRYAIQLKKDGDYRLWPFDDLSDYEAFTYSLAVTWSQLNRGYKLEALEEVPQCQPK